MLPHPKIPDSFFRTAFLAGLALLTLSLSVMPVVAKPGGNGKGRGAPAGDAGAAYQPEGRLLWTAPLQGRFSLVRPVIGPQGRIYVVDVDDNLHAFEPDGSPAWGGPIAGAGSKGVDVSPDGATVYTGNENWIKAFNTSDGSLKWTFTQSPRAFILIDVAVAPDGAVCGVASSGMGVFCLDDRGQGAVSLRWQNAETYARPIVSYTEIQFGPAARDFQLYFAANGHTRAVNLTDGSDVFTVGYFGKPVVSPFDGTWHLDDQARNPDGTVAWTFEGFPTATAGTTPSLSTDGTHYTVNQGLRVFAIDPFGTERWRSDLPESVGEPDVDPTGSQVLMPTAITPTSPAGLLAVAAGNGTPLWRAELPPPAAGLSLTAEVPLAFSAGGDIVYVIVRASSSTSPVAGAYLYALATDPAIPTASTVLRSTDVALDGRRKGRNVAFAGTVTVADENRAPVSGAAVTATWTLPDGSQVTQTATTGSSGEARFGTTGIGGIYRLTVTDITNAPYVFDADHSVLTGTAAVF